MNIQLEKEAGDPVMGIDEAGRGPLAGPVFAAAVHLPVATAERLAAAEWATVNDSKKLSGRRREAIDLTLKREVISLNIDRIAEKVSRGAKTFRKSPITVAYSGICRSPLPDGRSSDQEPSRTKVLDAFCMHCRSDMTTRVNAPLSL